MTSAVRFSGLFRQVLASGGTNPNVRFSGINRKVLANGFQPIRFSGLLRKLLSARGVPVRFSGVIRQVLCEQVLIPPFGSIPVFPVLPQGFPVKVTPVMATTVGISKSLREMRQSQQPYPLWDIEILFEELLDQTQNQTPYAPFSGYIQYMDLVQLWLMMYGKSNVFCFNAPWDNSRYLQQTGVGDGSTYIFTIYHTWGQSPEANLIPIGAINTVTGVYINGTLLNTSLYSINRNKITFTLPPQPGAIITITMTYYYLCRFVGDEQVFVEFAKDRWAVTSLKFRNVYWP